MVASRHLSDCLLVWPALVWAEGATVLIPADVSQLRLGLEADCDLQQHKPTASAWMPRQNVPSRSVTLCHVGEGIHHTDSAKGTVTLLKALVTWAAGWVLPPPEGGCHVSDSCHGVFCTNSLLHGHSGPALYIFPSKYQL